MAGAVTCNEGDGPCPSGSFCWGNVECQVAMDAMPNWLVATSDPTESPTKSPMESPASPADSPQNYCGTNLAQIEEQCASGSIETCNGNDEPCPSGTFCFGQIMCPVPVHTAPPRQNYCGTSLASIRANCASGNVPTCNGDDGPCASGTYCWGDVECDPIETHAPTASPAGQTIESFLDSFFSSNTGGNSDSSENKDEVEVADEAPTEQEAQAAQTSQEDIQVVHHSAPVQEAVEDCLEGTFLAEGLPGCCVPDPSFLGDGACDAHAPYNAQECGYDRGDCCRESCDPGSPFGCKAKEGDEYGPFGFFCLDPTYGPLIDEGACQAENREWVGDGGCDPEYNTQACGWDGGDCCRETCNPDFAYYECGRAAQPFDCKDPNIIYRAGYVP